MGGAVDLHSHTTASDGSLSPRELVRLAVQHGVRVLAITDHDSTDGLADAMDEAQKHPPLQIVPGLEINCDVPSGPDGVSVSCAWAGTDKASATSNERRDTDRFMAPPRGERRIG